MKISLIVAYGKNKELGLNNELLWHIPEDLKNFKELTNNHHVFMGKNTYNSIFNYLKKPLPNRFSLVLTSSIIKEENAINVSSIEEAINIAKNKNETEFFIIGGASIYKQFIKYADKIYLSEIDYEGKADCFFEGDIDNFEILSEEKKVGWTYKILNRRA